MKYLFFGPCRNRKDPSRIGGIVVLFDDWLEQCCAAGVDFEVIDTNKANYASVPVAYVSILPAIGARGLSKTYPECGVPPARLIGHSACEVVRNNTSNYLAGKVIRNSK